jgi:EAL and modified HD-GYP domain-containing signal transduction protein
VFLPREKVILEIIEGMQVNQDIVDRVAQLADHGFSFALDDVIAHSEQMELLMPMVDYIKLDLRDTRPEDLGELAARYKASGKKLVAEKVETREEFQTCLDLGFDYFQGYYFAKPVIITGRKLSTSQMALVNLMSLVTSDAEHVEVERAVKRDVTVALNLLRLVNTPAVGARHRIDSVSQAVTILGRRQLQRWLQIMLFAEPGSTGQPNAPLLMLATTRGRMMELLTQRLHPTQRHFGDIAFTVGIMSLMDTLFGMPMGEMLEQMPVIDEVQGALLEREGFFGELLRFVESLEQIDENEDRFVPALQKLALSSEELVEMEMSAFAWSDTVVRYAI